MISASSGVVAPIPDLGLSNALRLSLVGWSKTLAAEVARYDVICNVVMPRRVAAGRITFLDEKKAEREGRSVDQVRAVSLAAIAMGWYSDPQEYGDVVAFLASVRASYVTGSQIRVDGGYPLIFKRDSMTLDPRTTATLENVTTATLTTILLKKGLRNIWVRGAMPLRPGQERVVGPAFTLRFVPAREDLATPASWGSPISTRAAIEAMPEGAVAVIDAMGIRDAGVFGDILCARMTQRKVAAMVTDGAVRDLAGVLGTGLPVWASGTAAPPSVAGLTFVGWEETIGCGGVCVVPGDTIVADADGAVVIPAAILEQVVAEAPEQERMEGWIIEEVGRGARLPGLYPMNEESRVRYDTWKAAQ